MAVGNAESSCLRLSPSGRLLPIAESEGAESERVESAAPRRVMEAFRSSEAEGLFELAARPAGPLLSPDLAYWRDFAALYLTARCHTPVGTTSIEAVEPLSEAELMPLLLGAPPMEGAEYLGPELLRGLWSSLDEWLRAEAAKAGGLGAFLAARAPLWHQVGRVCFHLAENRKDPDFPFAFLVTYAPRLSGSDSVRYQPLSRALQEFAGEGDRKALAKLLTPIHEAAGKSPLIRELLDSKDIYHPLAWTADEAYRFLQEIPLFEESGVLVRVPDWWAKRPRPRVAVSIGSRGNGFLGAASMLDFDIGVALGEEKLSAKELKEILAGGAGLAFLKGKWVEIDPERLSEALEHWKRLKKRAGEDGISFVEGMRLLAGAPSDLAAPVDESIAQWSFVDAGSWLKKTLEGLRSPEGIELALPDAELKATLRHYQEAGLRWLWLLSRLGLGACLADDMGLGKTIQVLALLLVERRESGRSSGTKSAKASTEDARTPSLLVLPASLLANWKAEIERFAPSLRFRFVHPSMKGEEALGGSTGTKTNGTGDGEGRNLSGLDLVVTTYGMLGRQAWISDYDWNLVILDEAQAVKNPGSGQSRAVRKLRARARIALTGTPVENRLSDLWALFDFLNPGLLGTAARFKEFATALEKREGERYAPLRNLVRPYILRRLKTDRTVIADLPEKTEVRAFCGLSKAQAALYGSIVEEFAAALRDSQGIARKGLILSSLMKLKQVCNHPSQVTGDGSWEAGASGKFARLGELCEEIASRQDRVLVFTQFREMTEPLESFLAGIFGRRGLVLHGGTPVAARRKLVETFQAENGPPFFVLSLKAGGTGLNLTAASHVIHFDRWWNPAVENQATDRAFRIGQKKNVLVHKFVCRGTVEEKIDKLIEEKTALARDLLEGGADVELTGMSDEKLLATVSLDLDRARDW
jgi:non-specific serine/threonine protein kinase